MNSSLIQILVLAGIAIFLFLKLRSVLGTRDGFEKPPAAPPQNPADTGARGRFEVIEGGPTSEIDNDITDHVPADSPAARAVADMKRLEPDFALTPFLGGARQAYEMILMAFERGEIASIRPFLSPEVAQSFESVVQAREEQGLTVEASFIGLKEMALQDASFDSASGTGELTVRFIAELTSVVRNTAGDVVEGDAKTIKRQRDVWTFARKMGSNDPNWQLVATGE